MRPSPARGPRLRTLSTFQERNAITMRAVVTRVVSASVTIDGTVNGRIGRGFLVLLGIGPNDTGETAGKLAEKICNLRVFEDENGKMNLSLEQVGGALLVVSQLDRKSVV